MTTGAVPELSLFVGVSGPRRVGEEAAPALSGQIESVLKRLETDAAGIRRVLLSSLADGFEQLFVELALKRKWEVIAALPMPCEDYVLEFATQAQRDAFAKLRSRCSATIEIPWPAVRDADPAAAREKQYREHAIFLARHSQVVVAMWDGVAQRPAAADHTAYVVELCKTGLPPIEGEVLAAPETTSLVHIPAGPVVLPAEKPGARKRKTVDAAFLQICKEFRSYNRSVKKLVKQHRRKVDTSRSWLMSEAALQQIDPATRELVDHFACADVLALDRQKQRTGIIKLASVATIVGAFAQATNVLLAQTPWMITYGVAVGLAYGLYLTLFRSPMFRIEDRYLEYRALAEALRVQVFWRLSGVSANVAEHYLQLVKTEVGWVREALRSMSLSTSLAPSSKNNLPDVAEEFWIDSQASYFVGSNPEVIEGKAQQCKALQQRFDFASNVALTVGACLVGTAIVASIYPLPVGIKATAFAYSTSLFLVAAVIKGYVSAMGFGEQASGYEKAGAVFRNAQRLFKLDPSNRLECLLALGKYALAENADWLIQRRKDAFRVSR